MDRDQPGAEMSMNDPDNEVKEARLRDVLRQARPAPSLPPRFQESVWRGIEREDIKSEPVEGRLWLERLVTLMLQPRLAATGVVAVLVLGGIVGALDGVTAAREAARDQYVASVAPSAIR